MFQRNDKKLIIKNNNINKKIIILFFIILLIIIAIFLGFNSRLMGNSVTDYYCEDESYTVEGNSCVKIIEKKYGLLGDINLDSKITIEDYQLLDKYVDSVFFEEDNTVSLNDLQMKVADIDGDGEVYENDKSILNAYLDGNINTFGVYYENIGNEKICENDYQLKGNSCIKKDVVSAKTRTNKTISVIYDANGGVEKMDKDYANYNEKYLVKDNKFQKNGYVFDGWILSKKDGNTKKYMCYKDNKKKDFDFLDISKCSENNYVMYKNNQELVIDEKNYGDEITFIAHWAKNKKINNDISLQIFDDIFDENNNGSDNEKMLNENVKSVNIGAQFTVTSVNKYYYKWNTYRFDLIDNDSSCLQLDNNLIEKKLDLTLGTRKGSFRIYSDSECKNIVSFIDTATYTNNKVGVPVEISSIKLERILTKQALSNTFTGNGLYIYDEKGIYDSYPYSAKANVVYNYKKYNKTGNYYYKLKKHMCNKEIEEPCQNLSNLSTTSFTFGDECSKAELNDSQAYYQFSVELYDDSSCDSQHFIGTKSSKKYTIEQDTLKFFENYENNKKNTKVVTYYEDDTYENSFKSLAVIDDSYKFKKNIFTKEGYNFLGWMIKNQNYVCYKDNNKNDYAILDSDTCDKFGYVVFNENDEILYDSKIFDSIDSFIAKWEKIVKLNNNIVLYVSDNSKKYSSDKTNNEYIKTNIGKVYFDFRFDIKDGKTYYYKWFTYKNGTQSYESECHNITKKSFNTSLDLKIGIRQGSLIIYSDSSCSKQITKYDTNSYYNSKYVSDLDLNKLKQDIEYYYENKQLSNNKVKVGTEITIEKNSDAKDGYIFNGWNLEASDSSNNKKYLCYKDSNKKKYSLMNENDCLKNGYVLFKPGEKLRLEADIYDPGMKYKFYSNWKSNKKINNDITISYDEWMPELIKYNDIRHAYINTSFDIKNNAKYYYKWITYRYGTLNAESECTVLKKSNKTFSLDLALGKRSGEIVVYSDEKCKKKISSFKTREYHNSTYDGRPIELVSADLVKASTRNILTKKIDNITKIDQSIRNYPYDTTLTYKIKLKRYDKNSEFSYNWITYKYSKVYSSSKEVAKVWYSDKKLSNSTDIILELSMNISDGFNLYDLNHIMNENDEKSWSSELEINHKKYYTTPKYTLNKFYVDYKSENNKTIREKYIYNYNNYVDNEYYHSTKSFRGNWKKDYDFVGYKVNNSEGKYACYKNSDKTSQGFTSNQDCNKYGYVLYQINDKLYRTTSKNKEVLTFTPVWKNNPIAIQIDKKTETNYNKGSVVKFNISFTINDLNHDYYYGWHYAKINAQQLGSKYSNSEFIKKIDPYNNIRNDDYYKNYLNGIPFNAPILSLAGWEPKDKLCRKITWTTKFNPQLTVDKDYNIGLIGVYLDSKCTKPIQSIKNVHKLTSLLRCKNC